MSKIIGSGGGGGKGGGGGGGTPTEAKDNLDSKSFARVLDLIGEGEIEGLDDKTCERLIQREDDREDTVRNRLKVYRQQTKPLVAFYKGVASEGSGIVPCFASVDGSGNLDFIQRKIREVLLR